MSEVAVFDINETTLDLGPVREVVDDLVGDEGGFTVWFQRLLQLSMTVTAVGDYVQFTTLARHALDATAASGRGVLPDGSWERVAEAMGSIEAYPDVPDGLRSLRADGWTTAALTNTPLKAVSAQLDRAGLAPLFHRVISVEAVRRFKPAPAAYRRAAEVLGADLGEMWMVACHDWDLAGARAVGMSTAFVTRPRMTYAETHEPPDVTVADFTELASELGGR